MPERVEPHGRPATVAVETHATEHLRFIRETMASAGTFTAVSGIGSMAMGLTACAAAAIAARQRTERAWLATWLLEAALALAIGGVAMRRKARTAGILLFAGAGRRFMVSYAAPVVAGAVLTLALCVSSGAREHGLRGLLPGIWLLLYGTAAISGGASAIRPIPKAGACFMALGTAALLAPSAWGDAFMAAGFGLLQIAFGWVIARRYGG